jgi:uncharacterized protein (DUF2147 family)
LPSFFRKFEMLPLCAVGAAFIVFAAASAQETGAIGPPDPTGEWMVAKGYARIKIVNCDGQMWGVVAWEQTPGVDSKNPDPSKRGRPTLGMPILLGMKQTKPYQWDGEIYNSQDGRTYTANIAMTAPDILRVQGCVLRVLCGGENWTRVTPPPEPPPPPARKSNSSSNGSKKPPAKAAANEPSPEEQICESLVGAPGLTHERRLK